MYRAVLVALVALLVGCSGAADPSGDFDSLTSDGTIPCNNRAPVINDQVKGCALEGGGTFVVYVDRPDDRDSQELAVAVGLDAGQEGPWLLGPNWTAVLDGVPVEVARDLRDALGADLVVGMDNGEPITVGS